MAETETRKYFLDGIRGWASVAVLLWHLFYQVFYYSLSSQNDLRYVPFINGVLAVHLFFVVSGFALSIVIIQSADSKRLLRMVCGRYFRLVIPIFAVCCLVYTCMISGLVPEHYERIPDDFLHFTPSLAHLFSFSFWNVFFNFSLQQAYVLPLWTMQYELAGSALIFFLLFTVQKRSWNLQAYSVLFLGLLAFDRTPYVYYALFIAGLILANVWNRIASRSFSSTTKLLLLSGIAIGLAGPALSHNRPGWIASICAIILFLSLIALPATRRFFETKLSRFLGEISFSLYLVHGPLLFVFAIPLFFALENQHILNTGTNALLTACVTMVLSFLCAIAFQPIDRFAVHASRVIGKKFASHPLSNPPISPLSE